MLLELRHHVGVQQVNPVQLVPQSDPGKKPPKSAFKTPKKTGILGKKGTPKTAGVSVPVGLDVVGAAEKFDFPRARRQPLDHPVDLVGFVAGGAHLGAETVILGGNPAFFRLFLRRCRRFSPFCEEICSFFCVS